MTSAGERAYSASPTWVQQSIVATYGLWWHRRRMGSRFRKLVEEFRGRDRWTTEQFAAFQSGQLQRVLQAAWASRHYRQVFTEATIRPDAGAFDAFRALPLLPKEALRARARDFLTQNRPPRGTLVFKSSGTTGTPTEIYYTREFHALELAVPAVRSLGWAGVDYRARRVMFGSRKVCSFSQDRPPFWRYSPAEDMAYASIYHLSARFLPSYLRFLREYRPVMIMGYPNALAAIASFALEHDDLPAPAKAVFTTSETVTEQSRQVIESAWKCRVYDRYGAVEGCVFASQCEHGRYHVSPEVGIVEILDENGKDCSPSELGEVVCTGLQNTLQPLIRYRIGDAARWAVEQNCPCGRSMPILERIEGRHEDTCVTLDGRSVLRFDTVFKGVESVQEAQVIQEEPDLFRVLVVPASGFNEAIHARTIVQNMRLHVGGNARVEVTGVSQIPRTASGKFRAVVCHLSEEEKRRLLRAEG